MKRVIGLSVVSTLILSACASTPPIDYSKVDAECVKVCQKEETECNSLFADIPTLLYTHCKPEARACVTACPAPGAYVPVKPATSNATAEKSSVADRLKQLEELHKNGLITDKEYADKRQEILKSL